MGELKAGLYDRVIDQERVLHTASPHIDVLAVPATSLSPFFDNYGFHPRMSLLPPSPDSRTPAADSSVHQLREAQDILQRELKKSKEAMERSANLRRRAAPNLVVGQKVWLLRRHIHTTRPSGKLDVRRLGPFSILRQIRSSAFRLALPSAIKIHPIFHVGLLKPHVANTFRGRIVAPPPTIHVDGVEEFEVNSILDSRFRRRELEYYVD